MKKLLAFLLLTFSTYSHAVTWICNSSIPPNFKLSKLELVRAYSGQPVLIGSTWLVVYTLPSSNLETIQAMSELGLSPEVVEKLAYKQGLSDRGIRITNSSSEMISKLNSSQPSAGFVFFFIGAPNVSKCF